MGAQTGYAVDDLAVLTDEGGGLFAQAKVGLKLNKTENSPLANAIEQAVGMHLKGRVPEGDSGTRPFSPTRDAIALVTDHTAPASIRDDLARALRRVASQPPGTGLKHELTLKQQTAIRVAASHVRRSWTLAQAGKSPSDEDLRTFFGTLHVLTLDLRDGRSDRQAALSVLHRGLTRRAGAASAWAALVGQGQEASQAREWRTRGDLVVALSRHGLESTLPTPYVHDISVIRERSAANLADLQGEARLPVKGGLYISRTVAQTLRESPRRDHVLVVGDAGSGKSAVLQDLATSRSADEDVVVLRARDVAGVNRLATDVPLQEVLRAWVGPPGLVVIDGLDALRGSEDRESLSGTVTSLAGSRWQVVASARTFDTRNSQPLQRAFVGEPLSSSVEQVHPELLTVRHLHVGDLTEADLRREIVAPMPLELVLRSAPDDLRRLLLNPFNLRLAADLAERLGAGRQAELMQVRTRVELLSRYWDWRVREELSVEREALLGRVAASMALGRRLEIVVEAPTVLSTDSVALEGLLTCGVLAVSDGPVPGIGRPLIAFSHNILFDYAAAIYVLYSPHDTPGSLLQRLDDDPTLPLVARPSFDLLVDLLWLSGPAGPLWPMALALAGSTHVLASLAVASRLVNVVHVADDLVQLAERADDDDRSLVSAPRHRLTGQIVGAARAHAVLPDPARAVLPLAELAKRLALQATGSFADAALATELLMALQVRVPVVADQPISPATAARCTAIASLFDAARTDPARSERIAGALARQLPNVIGVSDEVRAAVDRLLGDDTALAQWGGTVLLWLPDAAVAVVALDADLARRLAVVSIAFRETRDESVALGMSPIVPLSHSRRDQARHAGYRLARVFPTMCDIDIVTATKIVCEVSGAADPDTDPAMWPLESAITTGWLEHGYGFASGLLDHEEDEHKMVRALAQALVATSEQTAQTVVELLVQEAHNAEAWTALMHEPERPAALCRRLFPAFMSGALLTHPDTFPRAAALLKAAAQQQTVPHPTLEAAVVAAFTMADRNGRGDYVKDVLVGCLLPETIRNQVLATHLADVTGPPPDVPPPPRVTIEDREWTPIDQLLEAGTELAEPVEAAARDMHRVLNDVTGDRTDAVAVVELAQAFVTAHRVFESAGSVPDSLTRLLIQTANKLAAHASVAPTDPPGPLVLAVLTTAAADPQAGNLLSTRTWSPGIRDLAIEGIGTLVMRQVWRTSAHSSELIRWVKDAMSDENALVRMTATRAFPGAYADLNAPQRVQILGDLLLGEADDGVRASLWSNLGREAHAAPVEVDQVLNGLAGPTSSTTDSTPRGINAPVEITTFLAIRHETPFAKRTVRHWAETAATSPETTHAVRYVRHYLQPSTDPLVQDRAFAMVERAALSALERWTRNPDEHLAEEAALTEATAQQLRLALDVLDAVADQIYFASGAYDETRNGSAAPPTEGQHTRFAELATPILLTCAKSNAAPILHHIVETLLFLAPLSPKRTLLTLAHAVAAEGSYTYDPMAGDLVIPYLRRLLAEQRPLVLFDEAGVSAFKSLLSSFASAGNEAAMELAFTFSDVFR